MCFARNRLPFNRRRLHSRSLDADKSVRFPRLLITSCVLGKVMGWNFTSIFCATLWQFSQSLASSPGTISRTASLFPRVGERRASIFANCSTEKLSLFLDGRLP
jgi:hypothetical protein